MYSLVYYAILGSLIAAAAGGLVLVAVTVTHTLKWRGSSDGTPRADRARRQRVIRLADSVALLCFAVSAGLAMIAVMQQARAASLAVEARDVREVLPRLEALETRLARVEIQQQAGAAPESAAAEDRIGRIERRIDPVETRATSVAPRVLRARTARPVAPPSVIGAQIPKPEVPARPSPAPTPSDSVAIPEAVVMPTNPAPESAFTTPSAEPSVGNAVVAPQGARSGPAGLIANQLHRDLSQAVVERR